MSLNLFLIIHLIIFFSVLKGNSAIINGVIKMFKLRKMGKGQFMENIFFSNFFLKCICEQTWCFYNYEVDFFVQNNQRISLTILFCFIIFFPLVLFLKLNIVSFSCDDFSLDKRLIFVIELYSTTF